MNVWEFMSNSPWLTFFLGLILIQGGGSVLLAAFDFIKILVRGYKP